MGMTQQFLYSTQLHPSLEHQDSKRVPQHMRSDICDTGLSGVPFDDQPETLSRQALAMMIQEQRLFIGMTLHQARTSQLQVFLCGFYRDGGERQDTLALTTSITTGTQHR